MGEQIIVKVRMSKTGQKIVPIPKDSPIVNGEMIIIKQIGSINEK